MQKRSVWKMIEIIAFWDAILSMTTACMLIGSLFISKFLVVVQTISMILIGINVILYAAFGIELKKRYFYSKELRLEYRRKSKSKQKMFVAGLNLFLIAAFSVFLIYFVIVHMNEAADHISWLYDYQKLFSSLMLGIYNCIFSMICYDLHAKIGYAFCCQETGREQNIISLRTEDLSDENVSSRAGDAHGMRIITWVTFSITFIAMITPCVFPDIFIEADWFYIDYASATKYNISLFAPLILFYFVGTVVMPNADINIFPKKEGRYNQFCESPVFRSTFCAAICILLYHVVLYVLKRLVGFGAAAQLNPVVHQMPVIKEYFLHNLIALWCMFFLLNVLCTVTSEEVIIHWLKKYISKKEEGTLDEWLIQQGITEKDKRGRPSRFPDRRIGE